MLTSSRVSRVVRNGLVLGTAAAAAVGLTGCKAVPSFTLDSSASGVHAAGTSGSGGASGTASRPGSDLGAAAGSAGSAAAGAVGKAPGSAAGSSHHSKPHAAPSPVQPAPGAPENGGGLAGGSAPSVGNGMILGTTELGHQQAEAGTGVPLAVHAYSMFDRKVPTGAMITVGSGGIKWSQVAQAAPGSSLYSDIVRWAQTLKSRGPVMVAFSHEPESKVHAGLGTSADFIAAYRHVESIFNQEGATNVVWTWQMTSYAFYVNSSDRRAAAKWYPGDAWVDNVGVDAYNFLGCAQSGNKSSAELAQVAAPGLAFARAHGKTVSFPEWGSREYPGRAQWLRNAQQFFVDNADTITAAFYFNPPPVGSFAGPCHWYLNSPADFGALRDIARDPALVAR